MPVVLVSFFSNIIIFITIFFMVKGLITARNRSDLSVSKYRIYTAVVIVVGILFTLLLPFGVGKVFELIFN